MSVQWGFRGIPEVYQEVSEGSMCVPGGPTVVSKVIKGFKGRSMRFHGAFQRCSMGLQGRFRVFQRASESFRGLPGEVTETLRAFHGVSGTFQ